MKVTGPSSNKRHASPKEVRLPANGQITIRRAENGVVVTVYDEDIGYDKPGHTKTFVAGSIAEINLVK